MKIKNSQNEPEPPKRFGPSGFFVLRTPLLPFDELLAWRMGLEASATLDGLAQLEEALARERLIASMRPLRAPVWGGVVNHSARGLDRFASL